MQQIVSILKLLKFLVAPLKGGSAREKEKEEIWGFLGVSVNSALCYLLNLHFSKLNFLPKTTPCLFTLRLTRAVHFTQQLTPVTVFSLSLR
jgi:hypothetical protein